MFTCVNLVSKIKKFPKLTLPMTWPKANTTPKPNTTPNPNTAPTNPSCHLLIFTLDELLHSNLCGNASKGTKTAQPHWQDYRTTNNCYSTTKAKRLFNCS